LKIVFFNICKKWGGGEKWHHEMAVGLMEAGVQVMAYAYPNKELYTRMTKSGISTGTFKISSLSFLNPVLIARLYYSFKKHSPDGIILNMSADVKSAGIAAKLAGIKSIIYRRGSAIPIRNSMFNRFLFKRVITNVLVNSEETKRTILANNSTLFPESKIKIIYNGVDINTFNALTYNPIYTRQSDEIVLGNLARLSKQKGQHYLIRIAHELKKRNVNFKMLIGGDGELKENLEAQVVELGLEKEVQFLGFISNVKSFLSSIDIFVFPSIWEGFGFSIVEAKLMRKPVVAFNISSNPEVIQDNIDGMLIEPFQEDSMVEAILTLVNSPEKRMQFGNSGYKDVEDNFSSKEAVTNLLQYLETLVRT
jgi:glycosyltransferase involved in cell wall biosynthesis